MEQLRGFVTLNIRTKQTIYLVIEWTTGAGEEGAEVTWSTDTLGLIRGLYNVHAHFYVVCEPHNRAHNGSEVEPASKEKF